MKTQEEIWLEALSTGEEEAYKVLFTRYYSLLALFAHRYLSDRQRAEDAVHDVILNLYLQKEKFNSIVSLKAYLYNAVKNRCLNILKRQKLKEKYALEYRDQTDFDTHDYPLLEAETYELLKNAIGELHQQTRKVYDLLLLGYDNSEIAQKLGITLDAVKAQKKRGKKQLKEKLQNLLTFFL